MAHKEVKCCLKPAFEWYFPSNCDPIALEGLLKIFIWEKLNIPFLYGSCYPHTSTVFLLWKKPHVSRVSNLIISYVSSSLISLATKATITDCTFGKDWSMHIEQYQKHLYHLTVRMQCDMSFSVTRDPSYAAVPVSGSLWTNHCGALLTLQRQIFHFPGKPHGIKMLLYPGKFL